MKKLGGILMGVLGAGLAIGGVAAIVKNKRDDDCVVDTVDYTEETYEDEGTDVEETEE